MSLRDVEMHNSKVLSLVEVRTQVRQQMMTTECDGPSREKHRKPEGEEGGVSHLGNGGGLRWNSRDTKSCHSLIYTIPYPQVSKVETVNLTLQVSSPRPRELTLLIFIALKWWNLGTNAYRFNSKIRTLHYQPTFSKVQLVENEHQNNLGFLLKMTSLYTTRIRLPLEVEWWEAGTGFSLRFLGDFFFSAGDGTKGFVHAGKSSTTELHIQPQGNS